MKFFTQLLVIAILALGGCIGTDLEDPLNEEIAFVIAPDAVFRVNWGVDLEAEFRSANGDVDTSITFEFTSSNTDVLQIIDGRGVGRSPGSAVITATIAGDEESEVIGELPVEVLESRESISITVSAEQLGIGQSFVFGANYIDPRGDATTTAITWSSADPAIATVSASGEVTGVSAGQVDVIVTAGFSEDQVSIIIVEDQVTFEPEVNITTFKSIFTQGSSFSFIASFSDETGMIVEDAAIAWSSSDESVATVSETGVVSALSAGSANIIATVGNVSGFVEINVEGEDEMRRAGVLRGIRGYRYSGNFALFVNDDDELILSFENVSLDNRAPGPYWYLSNSESSINGGINLGAAASGSNEINVTQMFPNMEIGIDTFDNFVIWCEPFNIQLGVGDYDE